MLKYCYKKWEENKSILEERLRTCGQLSRCGYVDLLKMTVECILNSNEQGVKWDSEEITVIDNGDYQGTLLFLIPEATYQPCEYEYLMTYVGYGSCSGCDTLQAIQTWGESDVNDETIEEFMTLCRHLVTNMVKPYNHGWRNNADFEHITMEVSE